MLEACSNSEAPEIDLAKIVNFDSFRAYRWLVSITEPNQRLYGFLRENGVDLNHVINLLAGAIALCSYSFSGPDGPKEDAVFLPVTDEDGCTPVDIAMFSMRDPSRFGTMLGLGALLGGGEVVNPATYWDDAPCRLLRTPLEWLREGIVGCAVIFDPLRAKPILDWAPGNLAVRDEAHANELVEMGIVDPKRLVVPVLGRAA
jgi:hypothetical protein